MTGQSRWQRFVRTVPLSLALIAVAGVWLAGCVWSFEEQTAFAADKAFVIPELLPLVLDGLAISLAAVAYAASLDGRAAVSARIGTAVAVAASASSNGAWAWTRTSGDVGAVVLAAGVPVAANLAFEVLLSELRRQVHRRRGMAAPAAIPWPRPVRIALAPVSTFREWRSLVLDLTALTAPVGDARPDVVTQDPPIAVPEAPPALQPPARPRKVAAARRTRKAVTQVVSDEDLVTRMTELVKEGRGRPTIMRELGIGNDRYVRLRALIPDASVETA